MLVLISFDALEAAKIDDQKKLDWTKHSLELYGHHLEGAVFDRADLRKADFEGAHVQGASFFRAQLKGAVLLRAHLQGASLEGAQPEGQSLDNSQLQGASLIGAQLQGAALDGAELQGASLGEAQLQGASLESAQLQGASLVSASLQGASLREAQLQRADFKGSTLAGTDMGVTAVWRTNFEDARSKAVFADGVKESVMSKEEFAALKAYFMKEVPEGGNRDDALKRIEKLNPDISGNEASARVILEKGSVDEPTYRSALADQLKTVSCSGDESAPYIARPHCESPHQSHGRGGSRSRRSDPQAGVPGLRRSHGNRQSGAEKNSERGQRCALTMHPACRPSS
jgi:uncharacterized protein YjbI with pentapeptide repeats